MFHGFGCVTAFTQSTSSSLLYSPRQPASQSARSIYRDAHTLNDSPDALTVPRRADLPQLTRQQQCVHISTQSESADFACRSLRQLARIDRWPAALDCIRCYGNDCCVIDCMSHCRMVSKFWWILENKYLSHFLRPHAKSSSICRNFGGFLKGDIWKLICLTVKQ